MRCASGVATRGEIFLQDYVVQEEFLCKKIKYMQDLKLCTHYRSKGAMIHV